MLTISAATVFAIVVAICLASYPTFAAFGVRRLIFFTELAALAGIALIVVIGMLSSVPVRRTLATSALPLLLLLDLVTTTLFYNPPNGREQYYPTTPAIAVMQQEGSPGRVTAIDRALLPNTARFYGLEDIRIHDPVAFRPYVAVLEAAGWDRSEYFGRFRSLPPQPLLDYLGVRYVLTEPERAPLTLPVAYSGPDAIVYRNDSAMERFFVPSRVVQSASPVTALLASPERQQVFARNTSITPGPARVQLSRYDNNGATLRVNASSETFIASSEVALPGWRLERNGAAWPMIEINGAFLGWTAPPGDSEFRLSYRPRWFKSSLAASAAGLLLFLLMLWPRRVPQSPGTSAC